MRSEVWGHHGTAESEEMAEDEKSFVVCAVGDTVAENAKKAVKRVAVGVSGGWLGAHSEHDKNKL